MKRLILIVIILSAYLSANPIDDSPTIYELQIIEPDNWYIEINMSSYFLDDLDSIFVLNKSDSAKMISYKQYDSEYGSVFVITQEDVFPSLTLDKNNDCVGLHFYFKTFSEMTKKVEIGSYPNSYLKNIGANQSIIYDMFDPMYFKSNEPTIGDYCNKSESCKIYGHFYDKNGEPLKNISFLFYNIMWNRYEHTDSTGFYTANRVARSYYYDKLRFKSDDYTGEIWGFQPVEFDLEPGDSIEVNFIATQSAIVPIIQNTIMFNNYPHPASNYTWFMIDNTDLAASALRINVYDLNGRKVDSIIPTAYQCRYDCSHLAQGSYILSLQAGRTILSTKKFQILK
jgi:hypothetical protein